jgi:putative ABC transport system substrate-binding protein
MNRRAFVRLVGGLPILLSGCAVLPNDIRPRMAHVGYLSSIVPDAGVQETYRAALAEHGWVYGQNLDWDEKYAENNPDRVSALAEELVNVQADLIVVSGDASAVRVVMNATHTIPILFQGLNENPVEAGLVASVAHPGGNVTGTLDLHAPLTTKRLELLRLVLPDISRIGAVGDSTVGTWQPWLDELLAAASTLGIQVVPLPFRSIDDLQGAFELARSAGAQAVFTIAGGQMFQSRFRISELASQYGRQQGICAGGGLMGVGANLIAIRKQTVDYIDRILRGAKPSDLPVAGPDGYDFVINRKAAAALGITFSPALLDLVTEWVD